MTIQNHLDQLRQNAPGCTLTAFGDLSSRLILRSSSAAPCPREVLDGLSQKAAICFSVMEDGHAPELIDADCYGHSAIMFTPGQSFVFGRSDASADDVTCAVIESAQDVEQALRATRETVQKIGEDAA